MAVNPLVGLHVAVTWLTVTPLPAPRAVMDRAVGGAAIAAVPIVGALLGGLAAGAAYGLSFTGLPHAMIGVLVVAVLALATRGMHLDGLADTADGLGCYGDPDRVRQVMRGGDVGPFGVAALVVVLGAQAVGFAALSADHAWWQVVFAVAIGRFAVVWACRGGLRAANVDGFGALVAGTQRWSLPVWTGVAVGAAWPLGVEAVCAVPLVALGTLAFTAHCARRMGGISGDVLGATVELSATAALIALLV